MAEHRPYSGKVYIGSPFRVPRVTVCQRGVCRDLAARPDVLDYGQDLTWGEPNTGAAALALALLMDALHDAERAIAIHVPFTATLIAQLPARVPWQVSYDTLALRIAKIEDEMAGAGQRAREKEA